MTDGRPIDHVVLAVQDLDRAAVIYQELGFTLTPKAAHEDQMGTSNRLAQFGARNFIELLEVDRPEKLARHNFAASPPFFSFGDHNRHAVLEREGLSMLAFASDDARADIRRFRAARLPTFALFDFERHAKLPDGASATVAFSLAFVQSREMPRVAFFALQNRAPDNFWKPEYQSHANGAAGMVAVYLSSPAPERDAALVSKMFGGKVSPVRGGFAVACGPSQELRVLTPQAMAEHDSSGGAGTAAPALVGIALATHEKNGLIPAAKASGMFIEWGAPVPVSLPVQRPGQAGTCNPKNDEPC
jgi:catechol 2,3-dioxygenase-like lactoylglutathione lyase family enzyme